MVQIICTQHTGPTVTAQATANDPVSWELKGNPDGGGVPVDKTADDVMQNGYHTATWQGIPPGSYRVYATTGRKGNDNQPVPFGTCP